MAKLFVFFVLALALQVCLAKPKSAAPPAAPAGNVLEDLATQAKTIADSVSKTITDSLPDSTQVTNVLKTQSQEFANNVQKIVGQLQTKLSENKGTVDDTIKTVSENLAKTVTNLQNAAGPETTAKAKELKGKLDENVKTVAQELDNLIKAVQPNLQSAGEQVSALTKNVVNEFVESARKLQTKVNEAVNTPQAQGG
ncbi:hypothetical protein, partial [Shimia sediminis]|uniref:hypothetical protein n=1 Tax=Shimia sediminis TaxID=2497945 RepID=UPI0013DF3E08